jgi:hypothetical protein
MPLNLLFVRAGKVALWSVFFALLSAGCGGGSSTVASSRVVPLAARLRQLRRGDSYHYMGTNQTKSTRYTIRFDSAIATSTISPTTDLVWVNTLERLTPKPLPPDFAGATTARYYAQNAITGDAALTLDGGGVPFLNLTAVIPGNWRLGILQEQTVATQGGPPSRVTFAVVGTETVHIPAGTFETWKTTQYQKGDSFEINGVYWWAPQVGTFVKAEYTVKLSTGPTAGETEKYALEMTSTNVPLPPTSP